jgi:hypothetical protein
LAVVTDVVKEVVQAMEVGSEVQVREGVSGQVLGRMKPTLC